MALNFFDQFLSPHLLGIPLVLLATLLPTLALTTQPRLIPNRTTATTNKLTHLFIKQLLLPLSPPGHNWALPLTTTMLYLLTTNLLGLLPYTFTPTTQLSMDLGLALPLWLMTVLLGLRNQPTNSIGHLLPIGTPIILIPILITIESISLLIRPLALGVRLTANLTAGHLLIQLISTTALTLIPLLPTIAALSYTTLFLLTALELAVAMIQAYVFTLLLSLYLQENV